VSEWLGGGKSREREGSYVFGKETGGYMGSSYRDCTIELGLRYITSAAGSGIVSKGQLI